MRRNWMKGCANTRENAQAMLYARYRRRLARHASRDTATLQQKIQTSIGNSDGHGTIYASVLALTEDSQITKMVRVCGHEDAGMHLAVS
jgi:hypothetical protein